MANIKSQKKRNLTNAKRAERNKAVKSELKTRVKSATQSVGDDANADDVAWRSSASTRPPPRVSSTPIRPLGARVA